jgi:hypothetical protein
VGHDSGAGSGVTSQIDDIPRRPLAFRVTRRELFTSLISDAEHRRSMGDRPTYKLKTLGTLADVDLAEITPVLVAGTRLSVSEGMIWGWAPTDKAPRRLLAAGRMNLLILDAIDGRTSLGAIADEVREETELSEQSFPYVRALFLKLVLARIATPA